MVFGANVTSVLDQSCFWVSLFPEIVKSRFFEFLQEQVVVLRKRGWDRRRGWARMFFLRGCQRWQDFPSSERHANTYAEDLPQQLPPQGIQGTSTFLKILERRRTIQETKLRIESRELLEPNEVGKILTDNTVDAKSVADKPLLDRYG